VGITGTTGKKDVKVTIKAVGICGSDVAYVKVCDWKISQVVSIEIQLEFWSLVVRYTLGRAGWYTNTHPHEGALNIVCFTVAVISTYAYVKQ
jgi:threonine dehydrogenase-like Zn-dependent dehydrogenase